MMGLKHLPTPEELVKEGSIPIMDQLGPSEFHTYDEVPKRSKLSQEELERLKRMVHESPILVEGERPGETVLTEDGKIEKRVLPPLEEWEDEELEDMTILDKDEFYDHVTRCRHCGTEFIAYENHESVRNFCPGCGKKLV